MNITLRDRNRYRSRLRARVAVMLTVSTVVIGAVGALPAPSAGAYAQSGQAWGWGENAFSSVGHRTTGPATSRLKVLGITDATAIAGDGRNGFALRTDGRVWSWGRRAGPIPRPVAGVDNVVAIAANSSAAYALRADGTVWAWGWNDRGQLGDGTTNPSVHTAVPVSRLARAIAIAAGGTSAYALLPSGRVYAWGSNTWGQLGDGTTETRLAPVMVKQLAHVRSIAAGGRTAYAVRKSQSVSAWGDNSSGQLGQGTRGGTQLTPVTVKHLAGATSIAASARAAFALQVDGRVRAWGSNASGRLGLGTSGGFGLFPHLVPDTFNVVALAAGAQTTYAMQRAGDVIAWGSGVDGQLGIGDSGTNPPGYTPRVVGVHVFGVVAIGAGGRTAYAITDVGP